MSKSEKQERFTVVINQEEQYSIWPVDKEIPDGWVSVGEMGTKSECLAFISQRWADMRPRSLRESELAQQSDHVDQEEHGREHNRAEPKSERLVDLLISDRLAVEVYSVHEMNLERLADRIESGLVQLRLKGKHGNSLVSMSVDSTRTTSPESIRNDLVRSSNSLQEINIAGQFTVDGNRLECSAQVAANSFAGTGHVHRLKNN